jgi:hypothetical protein
MTVVEQKLALIDVTTQPVEQPVLECELLDIVGNGTGGKVERGDQLHRAPAGVGTYRDAASNATVLPSPADRAELIVAERRIVGERDLER